MGWVGRGQVARTDSMENQAFSKLATQMHIKAPRLKAGEYQVRLWVKVSIAYGTAQKLFLLDKKQNRFLVSEYLICWNEHAYRKTKQIKNRAERDTALWQKLLADDLLTLPSQATLHDQISPKPRPPVPLTAGTVNADGEFVVKARRTESRGVMISDGTTYRFEVFSQNSRRTYSYHSPGIYARARPKIIELQKATSLLKQVYALFGEEPDVFLGRRKYKNFILS